NKALKVKAQKLAKEMGLPLGTLLNNYLKQFIIDREVTFTSPMPNKKTRLAIEQARRDIKAGENLAGPFDTVKDMMKSLNS
ncbi:MAG: hypothetical protein WCG97_03980, partial [bacterium]